MPFNMMDIYVLRVLAVPTIVGLWMTYWLSGWKINKSDGIQHVWVFEPVYWPLVTRTHDFPDDVSAPEPLAIEARK